MESPNATAPTKSEESKKLEGQDATRTFVIDAKMRGVEYRNKFISTWTEIENQIRCVTPDTWNSKEDWQTKIYIPQQAKKSEIAQSYLNKMLFGQKKNFDIEGVETNDKDRAENVERLIHLLLNKNFHFENKFVMNEGIDLGTGFLKFSIAPTRDMINFSWVSIYKCVFDPACGHSMDNMRYWIHSMDKDLNFLRNEYKKEASIYNKAAIKEFFTEAEQEAVVLKGTSTAQTQNSNTNPVTIVKGIDGTQDVMIPAKYLTVWLDEFWGKVPNDKGEYEDRVVSIVNDKKVIRNEINPYGFIPAQWLRVKKRKYDSYGLGYMENTRGLQDLANTSINLGFDSLKISAMDILIVNDRMVDDPTTIKYKPLAIWKMKDINGAKITRTPISAIGDVLRGIGIIDQIDQDASGINRQLQSSPSLGGLPQSETDTLGEYETKLRLIDQRFLDVAEFIEEDYFIPLIKKIYQIIVNPQLFTQEAVNRLLGMAEEDEISIVNGEAKTVGKRSVPKLDLAELRKDKDMFKDFRALGVTQFAGKIEKIQKLEKILGIALKEQTLSIVTKVDKLWEILLRESEIDDYKDLIRTQDEIRALVGSQQSPGGPQGQPQAQGAA